MRVKNNTRTLDSMLLRVCGVIKAREGVSRSPVTGGGKKSIVQSSPFPSSLAVIEIENQMSGGQIIVLSISSCPPSAGQWRMITELWIWRGRNVKLNSSALVYQTWQLAVTDSQWPDAAAAPTETSRLLTLTLTHLNMMKCVPSPTLSSDQQDVNVFLL